ncbi:helix-turn-helix domain-containing protein [Ruicaihuangia caeni]|uniref:Helix-turn-helix domain-containing protein n=1 Tax=Ruicaihuangia caeni TaxID=3042517 RepID=A0AAW6T3M6_9MICO|nr:helix-turn-helix domain-containing protein [Klugiella sp. YN-L-19]MDI2098332.1 helix-turn-helix domain-containing protein [Klugiella sp. YN-L-19]
MGESRAKATGAMSATEVLSHPVRLRVVQALLGGRSLTTAELRDELGDVAPATLYRQIAALAAGGVLTVVAEQQVRGATERTYALVEEAASVDAERARELSVDDHRRLFATFVAGLLADYDRYLDSGSQADGLDLARDLVGYRQRALMLTDDELVAMLREFSEVIGRYDALAGGDEAAAAADLRAADGETEAKRDDGRGAGEAMTAAPDAEAAGTGIRTRRYLSTIVMPAR